MIANTTNRTIARILPRGARSGTCALPAEDVIVAGINEVEVGVLLPGAVGVDVSRGVADVSPVGTVNVSDADDPSSQASLVVVTPQEHVLVELALTEGGAGDVHCIDVLPGADDVGTATVMVELR